MESDAIHAMLKHQAQLKCGDLWSNMNEKEQLTAMLKVEEDLLKEYDSGKNKN